MTNKRLLPVFLVPAALLLIPLVAMQFTSEVKWRVGDFVVAWVLMSGVGLAFRFLASRSGSLAYRLGAGLALAGSFMIVWGNLAVGFIGSEDNPANLLYAAVLGCEVLGAVLARFEAAGLARAMVATAAGLFLVPVVALLFWPTDFEPGVVQVFGFNFAFVLLFGGAAALFRLAARQPGRAGTRVAA